MIFSQYGYKNFHNENIDKHPITPYTLQGWVKMVNDNRLYCSKMNFFKWVELYFWVFFGRVKFCDLPSFHEYWSLQVRRDYKKKLIILISKYELCKKDQSQIKYLFNSNTSLNDIEKKINEYKILIKK